MTLVLPVPGDLADALEADAAALSSFERLSYSRQRFVVESVDAASSDVVRRRRVDRALGMLREGRIRFGS